MQRRCGPEEKWWKPGSRIVTMATGPQSLSYYTLLYIITYYNLQLRLLSTSKRVKKYLLNARGACFNYKLLKIVIIQINLYLFKHLSARTQVKGFWCLMMITSKIKTLNKDIKWQQSRCTSCRGHRIVEKLCSNHVKCCIVTVPNAVLCSLLLTAHCLLFCRCW